LNQFVKAVQMIGAANHARQDGPAEEGGTTYRKSLIHECVTGQRRVGG
jgi:hypothetical protein